MERDAKKQKMDNTDEVVDSLEAQEENKIRGMTNPTQILSTLRTVAFSDLDVTHKVRVRRVIWGAVATTTLSTNEFNKKFEEYLKLGPSPPLRVPGNGIIIGADGFYEVVLDDTEGIRSVPFRRLGWSGLTLTMEARGNLPRNLQIKGSEAKGEGSEAKGKGPEAKGEDSEANVFTNNCRKLANVMVLLNVHGQRFIGASTLLNTFNSGHYYKNLSSPLSTQADTLLNHIHSVSSDVLWGPVLQEGIGNVVVIKWKATTNDDPVGDYFLQVAWE